MDQKPVFQGTIRRGTGIAKQANFTGSNIFGIMEICSRHEKFERLRVNHSTRLEAECRMGIIQGPRHTPSRKHFSSKFFKAIDSFVFQHDKQRQQYTVNKYGVYTVNKSSKNRPVYAVNSPNQAVYTRSTSRFLLTQTALSRQLLWVIRGKGKDSDDDLMTFEEKV